MMSTISMTGSSYRQDSELNAAEALAQLVSASSPRVEDHSHCVSDDESSAGASHPSSLSSTSSLPSLPSPSRKIAKSNNGGKPDIFPLRLHRMLSSTAVRDVLTWLPHGQSFVVLRPDVFAESVLPAHFPESGISKAKYPSFTRKLNRWGFRQVNRGPDAGAFRHPLFQRDRPELCQGMECQKSSGRRGSKSKSARASAVIAQSLKTKRNAEFDVKEAAVEAMTQSPLLKSALAEAAAPRIPLKKRKLSHVVPASSSAHLRPVSISETPALTSMSSMPRRVSSCTEKGTIASSSNASPAPLMRISAPCSGFEATLSQLKASMERARAAKLQKEAEAAAAAQQSAAAIAAVPIQPRAHNLPIAPRRLSCDDSQESSSPAASAAEEHKSMLYKAFLQAMQQ